ncbi:MAG: hypothetical protein U9R15_18485 [Chloroflexota bacterium]|nr:hypothetical protein [Chloroflexota bacterium]
MSDIRTFLGNDSEILAAFGERIGIDNLEDEWDYPQAKISLVDFDRSYYQASAGNALALVQIDVYDNDRATLDINVALVENLLSGYRGKMGYGSYGRVFVQNIQSSRFPDIPNVYRKILEVEIGTENR